MNPIERLEADLIARIPGLATEMDPPALPSGIWHLDVEGADSPLIVVEWQEGKCFGISTPGPDDFGTRPDEIYLDDREAADRVAELIRAKGRTQPPTAVTLAALRAMRGMTQAAVAERAGVKQAAIARMEGRGNVQLETLERVAEAMGGKIVIRVEFPDGVAKELDFGGRKRESRAVVTPSPPPAATPKFPALSREMIAHPSGRSPVADAGAHLPPAYEIATFLSHSAPDKSTIQTVRSPDPSTRKTARSRFGFNPKKAKPPRQTSGHG